MQRRAGGGLTRGGTRCRRRSTGCTTGSPERRARRPRGSLGRPARTVRETVNAKKTRIGRDDALKLLTGMDRLVAARGQGGRGLRPEEGPAGRRDPAGAPARPDRQPAGPDGPGRQDAARRVQRRGVPSRCSGCHLSTGANTTRKPTSGSRRPESTRGPPRHRRPAPHARRGHPPRRRPRRVDPLAGPSAGPVAHHSQTLPCSVEQPERVRLGRADPAATACSGSIRRPASGCLRPGRRSRASPRTSASTAPERRLRPGPAGVLPLRLGRQSVSPPCRRLASPSAVGRTRSPPPR